MLFYFFLIHNSLTISCCCHTCIISTPIQRVQRQLQSPYTFEFTLNSYIRKNITFEIRILGLIYCMHLDYLSSFIRGVRDKLTNVFTKTKRTYVAISIKDSSLSYPPSSKLFCNLCNFKLVLFDAQMEEWYCNRCNVSYFPNKGEKVKRANKFETPGPNTDIHGNIIGDKNIPIAVLDNKRAIIYHIQTSQINKSL